MSAAGNHADHAKRIAAIRALEGEMQRPTTILADLQGPKLRVGKFVGDKAGNTTAAISSAGFKIDKTAPVIIDQGPTTAANGNGWYKADVTDTFKATDALSGLGTTCSTAFPTAGTETKTTTGEGSSVTVTSDSCTDQAGNTATAVTSRNGGTTNGSATHSAPRAPRSR